MKMAERAKIIANFKLNENYVYKMMLNNLNNKISPGQFVDITIPGVMLPRPISVSDYDNESGNLTIIYRVVGEGTEILSKMEPGEHLNLLTGLGNGFSIPEEIKQPLIIGGGLGVAPLFYLIKEIKRRGLNPKILVGFKSQKEAFGIKILSRMADDWDVVYESDGLLVTDKIKSLPNDSYDYFYACGPKPMLKAVNDMVKTDGELSLESRMACGIGICKCCSIETNEGMKTLCNDGPVLKKGCIKW